MEFVSNLPAHMSFIDMLLMLILLYFQLRKEVDKPLKTVVISVYPEEVNFLQIEQAVNASICPLVITLGTRQFASPVSVHD